jgi:cytidylate kinase
MTRTEGPKHSAGLEIIFDGASMPMPNIIAIDGPAASGKSTLGKKLADELDYLFFDTGVMYRAVTWAALKQSFPLDNQAAITKIAEEGQFDIQPASVADGRNGDVLFNGQDITWEIRRPEVDRNVSLVSTYSGVRRALTNQQRRIGQRGRIVMVGRDIGTVVMPDAELKIYLVASAEERARRRYQEQLQRGSTESYEAILSAIHQRDQIDSNRPVAPLRPAPDAVVLDTDHLEMQQVLEKVKALVFAMAEEDPT